MVSLDKIYHASYVLRDVIRNTELIRAPKIRTDCEVFLKPECLQVTGSFKVRGSGYMISQLTDEEKAHGVIACSAGNHAQGVALAAGRRTDFQGRSHQKLWCGGVHGRGRVRRCLQKSD